MSGVSTPSQPPSTPSRRSKWSTCVEQVFAKERVGGTSSEERARFYQDLFCLKINAPELGARLDQAPEDQLQNEYQKNVSDLFTHGVRTLKVGGAEDIRCGNVLDTLIVLCRHVLPKKFQNYSLDLINLLAGSLERSDTVFNDFVSSVDNIIRDTDVDLSLRRRSLQLALTLVAGVNQGSINAYFLRRDLFNTISSLISDPETTSLTFDAILLLGLLANFRKYEARNSYLVRIEDWVDEKAMEKVLALAETALKRARQAYLDIVDDSPPSFVGSVTSLVGSLRLGELVISPFEGLTHLRSDYPLASSSSSSISSAPQSTDSTKSSPSKSAASPPNSQGLPSNPFQNLPPAQTSILLPIYDLLHSNKLFLSLLLSPDSSFLATLLSFTSYELSHASSSGQGKGRGRSYGRLLLICMLVLVEEGGRGMSKEEGGIKVRLCRQRVPPLPYTAEVSRPPICAILDCAVLFLRHNLQKKLNVDSYIVCLKLIHRVLITLQAARERLDYDWTSIWQALISLGGLLASRVQELRSHGAIDLLAQQILDIFSFASIWAEPLFKDTPAVAALYFEILRADQTFTKLGDIAGVGALPSTPSLNSVLSSPRTKPLSISGATGASGSIPGNTGVGMGSTAGPGTIEAARNVRRIVAHFGEKVEEAKKNGIRRGWTGGLVSSGEMDANAVMGIIKVNIDSLDLIDSSSLEGAARYSELEHEVFMRDLTRYVAQDILELHHV